jgi:hypothetical protein
MVMDSGPFPNGRIQTFKSIDSNIVSSGIYEERFDERQSLDIPIGFQGTESLLMRNGTIVPFRVYEKGVAPSIVLDAKSMQCTDEGYIHHHHADVLDLNLFGFDAAGDINRIDWARILASDELQDVIVRLWSSDANQSNETYQISSGFTISFAYAASMTSYNDLRHRALCEKLQYQVWVARK